MSVVVTASLRRISSGVPSAENRALVHHDNSAPNSGTRYPCHLYDDEVIPQRERSS